MSLRRLDVTHHQLLTLWHHLHVDMKSLLSWQYLVRDIQQIQSWSQITVSLARGSPGVWGHVVARGMWDGAGSCGG